MKAEIITIGSELLLGQIVDTNSAFIAKCLAENGIELVQTQTVGDDLRRIEESIRDQFIDHPLLSPPAGSARRRMISPGRPLQM